MAPPKRLLLPKSGDIRATVTSAVSEREIVEERENIVFGLHSAYLNLVQEMAEFQQQWDKNPTMAFITSAQEGFSAGGAAWLSDQAELFEKETWINLGGKIEEMAGSLRDTLASHSRQQFANLEARFEKHAKNPGATVLNWAWWQRTIKAEVNEQINHKLDQYNSAKKGVEDFAKSVLNTAETARKIYKHRDAILNLPNLIAKGEPRPIQAFVENELMDIDREFATAIRYDKNFAVVLEIIADNDSALTYLSYVGLMFEAIPPNFYAYAAGKGGAYVMIEVIMLVVTALLSAGSAAAMRIATLAAKFVGGGVKVITASSKIKRAQASIAAFTRSLEAMSRAADDLHSLGAKLVKARGKPLVVTGKSKTTISAKKDSIKRDKKCRVCGSADHVTPNYRLGTVVYK